MSKEIPEHKDKLGRVLKIGDCVAYPANNSLIVGTVKKFNPKMITIAGLGKYMWTDRKYSFDTVLLEGPDVTMYILKQSS